MERRCTALVLSEQINIVAEHDPELTFVKSKFVTGHGTGGIVNYSNEAEMNFKKQEEVLRQFRRHEFNLLIATCVVEEGLDIPKCNVVYRFDFPKNFCSYVQSKGRARAKDSSYYILVDREEQVEKKTELAVILLLLLIFSKDNICKEIHCLNAENKLLTKDIKTTGRALLSKVEHWTENLFLGRSS